MENEAKKNPMIVLTKEDFKIIIMFMERISIPFEKTTEAAKAREALMRAKLMDIYIKTKE